MSKKVTKGPGAVPLTSPFRLVYGEPPIRERNAGNSLVGFAFVQPLALCGLCLCLHTYYCAAPCMGYVGLIGRIEYLGHIGQTGYTEYNGEVG